MEMGLFHDYFGNFPTRDERYYFRVEGSTQGEIEPMGGENETNLGKQEKLGKLQISFWVEGPLLTIRD